jgi:polysaccharide export outer membrane protein
LLTEVAGVDPPLLNREITVDLMQELRNMAIRRFSPIALYVLVLTFVTTTLESQEAVIGAGLVGARGTADYVINPQDTLRIDVWKEPELSGTVPVRPDGKISLPLLNDVQAAGLTSETLSTKIRERLQRFVNQPNVTVVVTGISSQRIYVIGEVTHSGAFPLLPNLTVLQAIADAGGLTPFAHANKIYIVTAESGKQVKRPFDYKRALKADSSVQSIALTPGDTIVVP